MEEVIVGAVIGVIGTVIGTVVGWILNSFSNRGKLHIYLKKWTDSFQYVKAGVMITSTCIEETTFYSYDLSVDIYNSSAEPRIMRDVRIVFNDRKNDVETSFPNDEQTKRVVYGSYFYEGLEALTIPAKSVINLKLRDGKNKDNTASLYIWKAKKVFFVYRDYKNKQHRILIKNEDYSKYFENHLQEKKNG